MREITLSNAQANQSQSVLLDSTLYDLEFRDLGNNTMGMTISANGVKLVDNAKCINNVPMLRYNWLQQQAGGNFMFISTTDTYPWYENFGASCQLVYANLEEIASVSPLSTFTQTQESIAITATNQLLPLTVGFQHAYALRFNQQFVDTVTVTGVTYNSAWQGSFPLYSTARTNICPLYNPSPNVGTGTGKWAVGAAGTGVSPTITNNEVGPDGTQSAIRVQANQGTGGGTTTANVSWITTPAFGPATTAGFVGYVWLKSNTSANQSIVVGTGNYGVAASMKYEIVTVTPTWQRFNFPAGAVFAGTLNNTQVGFGLVSSYTAASSTADFLLSYVEVETGVTAPGILIPTTGAAASQTDYTIANSTGPLGVTYPNLSLAFIPISGDTASWSGTGNITFITLPRSGVTDQLGPPFTQPGRWNYTTVNEPIFTNSQNVSTLQFQILAQGATVISCSNVTIYVNGVALVAGVGYTWVNAYTFLLAAAVPDNGTLTWSGSCVINFNPSTQSTSTLRQQMVFA